MTHFERTHADKLKELDVTTWLRYVDDVFATLRDSERADEILQFLNQQHPNIRFTIEHELNGRLAFLDTSVYRGLTTFHTTLYRKKTFTGVYLNWTSLTSKRYKISLIYCLLDRIWKICSEVEARETEIKNLRQILAQNDYPEHVVEREINKFIEKRSQQQSTTNENRGQQEQPSDASQTRFIVLPFVSQKAEGFAKRLKGLVNKYYPNINFNVAFKTPDEIGKHFPYKDKVGTTKSRSLVVYRIKCGHEGCDASYIGKTERILHHRIKEHMANSSSACHQHEKTHPGHRLCYDDVEILDSADSNFKLECKELLHIVQNKPSLNRQLGSQSNYNIKTLIIAAYPQYANEASTS
jgi:hypothetical protein